MTFEFFLNLQGHTIKILITKQTELVRYNYLNLIQSTDPLMLQPISVRTKILLNSIVNEGSNNKESNGHILKLQGHLFFNKEMWSKANEFYDKSLKIFIINI